MPYVYQFQPASMSAEQYEQCMVRLKAAGQDHPEGRLYHAAHGSPDRLRVFDIWASPAAFEAFGRTLVPILQELGVDAGAPEITEVHGMIAGS